MLIFKNLKYKNFLSSGNSPIEFNLNKTKTTQLVGNSGSGKCLEFTSKIRLRDKKTGEIFTVSIGDFFNAQEE